MIYFLVICLGGVKEEELGGELCWGNLSAAGFPTSNKFQAMTTPSRRYAHAEL